MKNNILDGNHCVYIEKAYHCLEDKKINALFKHIIYPALIFPF